MAKTKVAAEALHLSKRARVLFLLQFILFTALSLLLLLSPEVSLQLLGWDDDAGISCARWMGAALISLAYFSLCAYNRVISSPHGMAAAVFILFSIFSMFVMLMAVLDQHRESNVNTVILLLIFLGLTLAGFYLKVTAEHNSRAHPAAASEEIADVDSDGSDEEAGGVHEDSCEGCKKLHRRYERLLLQQKSVNCFDFLIN